MQWLSYTTQLDVTRTWREFTYVILSMPLTLIAFVWLIAHTAIGLGLSVTVLGIPLLALVPLGARMFGEVQRKLANGLLQENIDRPEPFRSDSGFFGWLQSAFLYGDGWRAIGYLVLRFPLQLFSFATTVLLTLWSVMLSTYPLWWSLSDTRNVDKRGVSHHSALQFGQFYFDTWPKALLVTMMGLGMLIAGPWIVRGLVMLDRILVRSLLGRTTLTTRMRSLEISRAHVVEDAAATLRRVERDLHDGAQARLVAVAMNLGEIKDRLARKDDKNFDRINELVDSAHKNTKEAITELRDVVRGIHPPVLDSGLEAALATLTSRSTIPVDLRVSLANRPGVAVESIAYFCVAELLANIAKHSNASRSGVDVTERDGRLRIQVSDDGMGGAQVGSGSGLMGLSNRVETVDGVLVVHSPLGGPTVVDVDLPMRN